jgi:hypothetical protein
MKRAILAVAILGLAFGQLPVVTAQNPAAGGKPAQPTVRPGPASSDQRFSGVAGFTIDYPKRDWSLLPSVGSALVVFIHKSKEAIVAVERIKIPVALAPNDIIDETAKYEVEDWRARRPYATGFAAQVFPYFDSKAIIIDLTQPGALGPEHARLYTLFRGTDKYRVICTTTLPTFEKYKETIHKMALSLSPTAVE